MAAMTSFHARWLRVRPPAARRGRVTSVPDPQYIRTCLMYVKEIY